MFGPISRHLEVLHGGGLAPHVIGEWSAHYNEIAAHPNERTSGDELIDIRAAEALATHGVAGPYMGWPFCNWPGMRGRLSDWFAHDGHRVLRASLV